MPSGQETLAGGIKNDESKRRMDLVPPSLSKAVAQILEFGARKYGDHNWRKGLQWGRVYAALQRHLSDFWDGQDNDSESGLPHLYHAACNIAFLIEFFETRKDLDNRYKIKKEMSIVDKNYETLQSMITPATMSAEKFPYDPLITWYNTRTGEEIIATSGALLKTDDINGWVRKEKK